MNANYLAAVLLIKLAAADFNGDAQAVSSAASVLQGSVEGFSSGAGIAGALGIQGYFPTLSSNVAALSGDAGSLQDSDIDVSSITSFAGAVSGLLSALTSKAGDFSSVGASQIVGNDLNDLSGPAADIVSNIVKAVTSDCDKISSLTDVLNSIKNGFSSAASAYSVSAPAFPDPSCQGGSGGAAAGGSSGSSSASGDSSAAASGSSSGSASGSGSSSASASGSESKSASGSSSETKSGSSSAASSSGASSSKASSSSGSSSASSKNAGVPVAGGLSAAAVGVVAWLL